MENNQEMYVTKRNGQTEIVSFDKILKRIKKVGQEVNLKLNYTSLTMKVIDQLYDGISTKKIDELTAEQCASMSSVHPEYNILAGRITVSNHHKNTSNSFVEVMQQLYQYKDKHQKSAPLVSEEFITNIKTIGGKRVLDKICIYDRDYFIEYFGFKTLEKSYLMKINGKTVERPQHMWLRVAIGIHGTNLTKVLETYEHMSQKYFTHATPTLFNAGTPHPQLSSCYLIAMEEDSIDGIFNTLKDCALISKWAGGIGLHIHNVRATGSHIRGTNGVSNGIVPMLKVFNNTAKYVDQGGGKRNGSFAIYLEPWHADILMFLQMRKNHGDEELKARDLFYALWIPDLFMERVKSNSNWTLMCPDECPGLSEVYGADFVELYNKYEMDGKGREVIKARDLWLQVLDAQMETGTPYLLYKDAANLKSNQKNIGTIKSSNLCVAPETFILTDEGYFEIASLNNQKINVWNGTEFSEVLVQKTGENQSLIQVKTSDGCTLDCTPYHKFFIYCPDTLETIIKEAKDLKSNDQIICCDFPTISNIKMNMTMTTKQKSDIYNKGVLFAKCQRENIYDRENIIQNLPEMEFMCLEWFAGVTDTNGILVDSDLLIYNIYSDYLIIIKLFLQTCGINPFIISSSSASSSRLIIYADDLEKIYSLGFSPKKLKKPSTFITNKKKETVRIISVVDNGRIDDTYCFNEPKKHAGIFNGMLTSQCTEIIQYSDDNETAVCNLASIALPTFITSGSGSGSPAFDYMKLHEVTKIVTENLNKIIDINYYPTTKTKTSNLRHRPIGIGIQGLADVFLQFGLAFTSDESKQMNRYIFETIYYAALEKSCELAETDGCYETFPGSPASQGILQFDMWGVDPGSTRYDWEALKTRIQKSGLRNSLLLAPMPTASTSQILGFNECIEPITSNIYSRRTLAGEFILVNKYLMHDLIALDLWNEVLKNNIIQNNGSVQQIMTIPVEIREKYRTVWEIPMKHLIDMSADRGAFICQSQSLNLWLEDPNYNTLTSMHFYAWSKGLKTGIYYLRRRPKHQAQQFTIEPEKAGVCEMCSS
jgi:ribonucleotide reductase alpha subunit